MQLYKKIFRIKKFGARRVMKIIFISIVSILLSLDLCARENPFEPTDTFIEIQKQYIIKEGNNNVRK